MPAKTNRIPVWIAPMLALALTLHLVPVNGAWRIYDLSIDTVKSYRADLLKANVEAAAPHK